MGEFIKYSKRKPKEIKEYLCRFQQPITGIWGAEYLQNTSEGLMVEHPDYNNLQWYEEASQEGSVEEDELWGEAALLLFRKHNPNIETGTLRGQKLLTGFLNDCNYLKQQQFSISKKSIWVKKNLFNNMMLVMNAGKERMG